MFNRKLFSIKAIKYLLFFPGLLLFSLTSPNKVYAQKNILVIHSYKEDNSWTKDIREGIDEEISKNTDDVQVFHEFLDAKTHPLLHHSQLFLEYIEEKYHHTDLNMLMVSDDPGLAVISEQREKYFADIPIVYLGINHVDPEILNLPNATGVFENRDVAETIIEASKQANSDRIIVINDTTQTGQANLAKINECYGLVGCPSDITVIDDLTSDGIQNVFEREAKNTPILLIGQIRKDSFTGKLYSFTDSIQILKSQVKNPIYGLNLQMLNRGIIGGKFLEGKYHGKQATKIAEKILQGTSVETINPVTKAENNWIFDAEQLREFDIDLEKLPEDAEIINKNASFYQKYKRLVWFTTSAFGVALLIILLLMEVIRRASITKKILTENESRYKDLAEAGANIFWEIDTNSHFSYVSGDIASFFNKILEEILGKSWLELYGNNSNFDFPWDTYNKNIKERLPIENLIYQVKQPNNELKIFQLNGKPIYSKKNQYLGYRGIKREITQEYNLSKTIAYQASYDFLTGLVNRQQFISHLKNLVDETLNSQIPSVLCYLDLDRFKLVNDTAGHLVGDLTA